MNASEAFSTVRIALCFEDANITMGVSRSNFEGPFQEWTFGFLNCKDLIDSTDTVYEFPMCDRDPVEQWSYGRLTLLGDAAHPMHVLYSLPWRSKC